MLEARAVFFDVGETLVDETTEYGAWADWLGVPHLTLFAVLGGVIVRGEHHHRALEIVRPGFDYAREAAARSAAGVPSQFGRDDLYPDAVPCLEALRAAGYLVGVAGNQPVSAERLQRELALPVDVALTAADLGAEKPAPEFFRRLAEATGLPPAEIAYVGDRLDVDVLPAAAAGMTSIFLRRGPWGYLQADRPEAARADIRLASLLDLPAALKRHRADAGGVTRREEST